MIILTDSHTHILPTDVPNYQEILENLKQNNIKRIIINGYNDKTNKEVLELVSKYENVYGALGFHPDNINELTEDSLEFIKKNLNNPKIIAIGEIGLDYYHNKENKEDQIKLLEKFLELSSKTNKPVIIHNREATGDLINTLKKYKTKLVDKKQSAAFFNQEYIDKDYDDPEDVVIARAKKFSPKPMYPEDACVQMELLGHNFFVFVNAETDLVNVVYKRKGNTYGIIEPE